MSLKNHYYWKSANNGLIAHLYEHIAVESIHRNMTDHGQFILGDYDLWGKTYGTTCYLDATCYSVEANQIFSKALQNFNQQEITKNELEKAALECAIENNQTVNYSINQLIDIVNNFHKSSWCVYNDLDAEQASDDTSVNTVFSLPEINFTTVDENFYRSITIEYVVNEKYTTNITHKALAVIIIQAVALNFYRFLNRRYGFYDVGDEWAYGANEVGYRTTMRLPQNSDLNPQLIDECFQAFKTSIVSNLTISIKNLLQLHYSHNYRSVYFGNDALNKILGGGVIGGAGWSKVATDEIITEIITNTTISVS